MQPRIEAEAHAFLQVLPQPVFRRYLRQRNGCKGIGIHLVPDLQRVAPIDKYRGLVPQDDRHPGRAAKTCQPGETLGPFRDEFALVFVRQRHKKPVEPLCLQFGPQSRQALRRCRDLPETRVLRGTQGIDTGANIARLLMLKQLGKHIVRAADIGQECRGGNSFQQSRIYLGLQ